MEVQETNKEKELNYKIHKEWTRKARNLLISISCFSIILILIFILIFKG